MRRLATFMHEIMATFMLLRWQSSSISFMLTCMSVPGCHSSTCNMCPGSWHGGETDGAAACRDGRGNPLATGCPGAVGSSSRQPHGNTTLTCSKNCEDSIIVQQ